MNVGFVGLGVMGSAMAGHLLDAGHTLTIWNRTPSKADELAGKGAQVAESLEDLSAYCDLVFLCVGTSEDVRECIERMKPNLMRGSIVVDHSTISPRVAIELRDALAYQAVGMVDAPVTGGSVGARSGELTIFCGGDIQLIESVRPYLMCYAKRVDRVGGSGAGQTAKLANQIAVAGSLLGVCESLSFAKKAGLNVEQIHELIAGGAGGSWAFDHYGPKILTSDWTPGFSISNQRKDLGYCEEEAAKLDAAIPGATLTNQLLQLLDEEGRGDWTTAALYEQLLCMGFES